MRVIPEMILINDTNRTSYTESQTMVVGLTSFKWDSTEMIRWIIEHARNRMRFGIEIAHQLDATYKLYDFAGSNFAKYLPICHPAEYKKQQQWRHEESRYVLDIPFKLMLKSNISKHISKTFNLMVSLVRKLVLQFFNFTHLFRRPVQPIPSSVFQDIIYRETDQEEDSEGQSCHRRSDTSLIKLALKWYDGP